MKIPYYDKDTQDMEILKVYFVTKCEYYQSIKDLVDHANLFLKISINHIKLKITVTCKIREIFEIDSFDYATNEQMSMLTDVFSTVTRKIKNYIISGKRNGRDFGLFMKDIYSTLYNIANMPDITATFNKQSNKITFKTKKKKKYKKPVKHKEDRRKYWPLK